MYDLSEVVKPCKNTRFLQMCDLSEVNWILVRLLCLFDGVQGKDISLLKHGHRPSESEHPSFRFGRF